MQDAVIERLIAPAVMISACGLLCMAQYHRLSSIVDRVRAFHRERLELHHALVGAMCSAPLGDARAMHVRYEGLELQARMMLRRATLVRNALVGLVGCILAMLACSLAIGLSMLLPAVHHAVIALFVAGLLLMLVAMGFALAELCVSLRQVRYEQERIAALVLPETSAGGEGS